MKLRRISIILGLAGPTILLVAGIALQQGQAFAALALMLQLSGIGTSRWLFFAEARHAVKLYY